MDGYKQDNMDGYKEDNENMHVVTQVEWMVIVQG